MNALKYTFLICETCHFSLLALPPLLPFSIVLSPNLSFSNYLSINLSIHLSLTLLIYFPSSFPPLFLLFLRTVPVQTVSFSSVCSGLFSLPFSLSTEPLTLSRSFDSALLYSNPFFMLDRSEKTHTHPPTHTHIDTANKT